MNCKSPVLETFRGLVNSESRMPEIWNQIPCSIIVNSCCGGGSVWRLMTTTTMVIIINVRTCFCVPLSPLSFVIKFYRILSHVDELTPPNITTNTRTFGEKCGWGPFLLFAEAITHVFLLSFLSYPFSFCLRLTACLNSMERAGIMCIIIVVVMATISLFAI